MSCEQRYKQPCLHSLLCLLDHSSSVSAVLSTVATILTTLASTLLLRLPVCTWLLGSFARSCYTTITSDT
jgi:hypothetical protein